MVVTQEHHGMKSELLRICFMSTPANWQCSAISYLALERSNLLPRPRQTWRSTRLVLACAILTNICRCLFLWAFSGSHELSTWLLRVCPSKLRGPC